MAITLPVALAASDMPHYIAQVVREISAELATFRDAADKVGEMVGMQTRLAAIEGRVGALEVALKGMVTPAPATVLRGPANG